MPSLEEISSGRKDAKKYANGKACFYCNKGFKNYRALVDQFRVHLENGSLRGLNFTGCTSNSSTSIGTLLFCYRTASRTQLVGTRRFQYLELHHQLTSAQCSARTKQTRLTGTDPLAVIPEFLKLRFSCLLMVLFALLFNSSAPEAFVLASACAAMSSAVFVPSNSVVTIGLRTDNSSYLVPDGVCHFNTDEFVVSQDGLPPTSHDALNRTQGYIILVLYSLSSKKLVNLRETCRLAKEARGPA